MTRTIILLILLVGPLATTRHTFALPDATQPTSQAATVPDQQPPNANASAGNTTTGSESRFSATSLRDQATTLFGKTFSETSLYGWITLLSALLIGLALGRVAQAVLTGAGVKMEQRGWIVRGAVVRHASGPANLALIAGGLGTGLSFIVMDNTVRNVAFRVVALLYIVSIAWYAYNLAGMVDIFLRRVVLRTRTPLDDTILSVVRKALRVFLVVMMGLFIVENVFGANIGTWLAGLGIAGLAVSLAAQDPIKNIFGSLTMLIERPFGLGDRIIFGNIDGIVEEIGLRSTRIRTTAGHLVAVPNMKFTDGLIENISRRPSLRRTMTIAISSETPPDKLEQGLQQVRAILEKPEITAELNVPAEPPQVLFTDFNLRPGSLGITVTYWYAINQKGRDLASFQRHGDKVNLEIMRALTGAGVRLV